MKYLFIVFTMVCIVMVGCESEEMEQGFTGAENEVKIMTLNPGHFHAGLVHKYEYEQVDPVVHIYAPEGDELESHLSMLEQFNTREENPTSWVPEVYRGEDYLEQMLEEKPGNVMVVSGNNARKIDYIHQAIQEGIHVLSDKPMVIHPDNFPLLQQSLEVADNNELLVNDIMTERHEITSILQRELSQIPELFGDMKQGSPEDPAITKESVHFFYKTVAGEPLVRPAWFFDVTQQGESIVDVSTHLVDLIMWQSFPGVPIDFENPDDSVEVISARSWDTELTPAQFQQVTRQEDYPDYLMPHVDDDSTLKVTANGEFTFKVKDIYGKVSALWGFENPTGGDTHFSAMRGTLANLIIRQDEEQDYVATLYVEPTEEANPENFESALQDALASLSDRYPGLRAEKAQDVPGWEIHIPEEFREGHEEHFTRVTEQFLDYLIEGGLPEWERTNLLTKYYITTQAYELSR